MNLPLRFESYLRPMVWGGRQLGDVLGKALPNGELYGEAWEISDHAAHSSLVSQGPHRGKTLRHLMEQHAPLLLGEAHARHRRFPWLIKLLDAWDWLSVQVHPSDANVGQWWPGEGGKTEAWFVLDAAPHSRIYAGLLPGVEEKHLRAALHEGTVADCLHQFSPRPGDCVFLPAGTVHAVGGGVLMAEVQQTSDATFRLFDWNRRDAHGKSRQLHIEEALACIDWNSGPVHPIRIPNYSEGEAIRQRLVSCEYFTLEYIQSDKKIVVEGGALQALFVLHGRGELRYGTQHEDLIPGETVLLPAALEEVELHPEGALGLLLSTLPY